LILTNNDKTINVASACGMSQKLYLEGQNSYLSIDTYCNYIENTMEKASKSGAVMITYAEEAFAIDEDDFENMVDNVKNLAKDKHIFVVLSLDIRYKNDSYIDCAILISDNGEVLYNYHKQHFVPFMESEYTKWNNDIKRVNTSFGYVGIVICYDIDFPWYINSLVKKPIDLLIIPSWDYPGIAEYHSKETRYRAIEGGFNVIKNTADGIVSAYDVKGRMITYHPVKDCEDYFVITTINIIGFETFYSYFEYFINYLYIVGIIGVLISGKIMKFFRKKKSNTTSVNVLNNENNNAGSNNLGLEDKD
jgi:apolipoprotein N-acyltransferase